MLKNVILVSYIVTQEGYAFVDVMVIWKISVFPLNFFKPKTVLEKFEANILRNNVCKIVDGIYY